MLRHRKIVSVVVGMLLIPLTGQIGGCGLLCLLNPNAAGCSEDETPEAPLLPRVVAELKDDGEFLDAVTGPQGPQGDRGPQGSRGSEGPRGPEGEPGLLIDDPDEVAEVLADDDDFLQTVRGDAGPPGLHCWDLDGDDVCDPTDDANGDGECDALDCQGADGGGGGSGDITGVTAGSGLTGGGVAGNVSLSIGTGSVTSTHLADNSVTSSELSDGVVTPTHVSSAGATSGDVITYNGSTVEWAPPGGGGGPSIEFAEDDPSINTIVLTTSWQTILPVTINVSQSGKVHAVGNASFNFGPDAENPALFGISLTPGGDPINIAARVEYGDSHPGGSLKLSATTQYVGSVGSGSHTFYLVAERISNSGGIIDVSRYQFSVSFFPD